MAYYYWRASRKKEAQPSFQDALKKFVRRLGAFHSRMKFLLPLESAALHEAAEVLDVVESPIAGLPESSPPVITPEDEAWILETFSTLEKGVILLRKSHRAETHRIGGRGGWWYVGWKKPDGGTRQYKLLVRGEDEAAFISGEVARLEVNLVEFPLGILREPALGKRVSQLIGISHKGKRNWREPAPNNYFVYFIQPGERPFIRIGKTRDLNTRIKSWARAFLPSERPRLLLALKGYTRVERELHDKFKTDRMHSEWFQFSEKIKEFIREVTNGGGSHHYESVMVGIEQGTT